MRGCWEGVGEPKHRLISLLPSPSCCGCPDSGFTCKTKAVSARVCAGAIPHPAAQHPVDSAAIQPMVAGQTSLGPLPPLHPGLRIFLIRQKTLGTTGICGETGKGWSPNWVELHEVSPGVRCGVAEVVRTREHPMGCGKGCAIDALGVLSCGAKGPCCTSQPRRDLSVQLALGAGRCSVGRAGCWGAGKGRGGKGRRREGEEGGEGKERREGRPRQGARQGVAPSAPIMHYWKHLAWAAGVCASGTHMCSHGYGDAHKHICTYEYVYISIYHTCVHSGSCVCIYPCMCTQTYTGMEVCTYM